MITADIIRLHRLAWRPGSVMHFQWWSQLQLHRWRSCYLHGSRGVEEGEIDSSHQAAALSLTALQLQDPLRQAIDRLICQKRCFPMAALPAQLSEQQQRLLALEDRLQPLLVAIGLQLLGSPDYLLRGHYRRVLAPLLGWQGLDQLWALWRRGDKPAALPPEQLVDQAQQCAYQELNTQLNRDPVWLTLSFLLPPPQPIVIPAVVRWDNPLMLLFRVARFL